MGQACYQGGSQIRPYKRITTGYFVALLMLLMATLACWSNDTLFIPPTETPTLTPVPPTPNVEGKFKIGESVLIGGSGFGSVYLTEQPEPETRGNRVPNA